MSGPPITEKMLTKQIIFKYVLEPLNDAYNKVKKDKKMVWNNENTITERLVWNLKYGSSIAEG
jgi:hypothetical protein